jgi:hypothetical protein
VRNRAAAMAAIQRASRETQDASIKPTQKVEVNGSAKVSVNFKNLPKNADASASGSGLLKDVNISKTRQMQPANVSPDEE